MALNTPTIFSDVSLNDRLPIIQKQIGMNYNTTKLYSIIPYSKLNYLYNSCLEILLRIRIQTMLMQLLRYFLFDLSNLLALRTMTEINVSFLFFLLSLKSRDAITMGNVLYPNQSIWNVSLFDQSVVFYLIYLSYTYYISGLMVSVFEASVIKCVLNWSVCSILSWIHIHLLHQWCSG